MARAVSEQSSPEAIAGDGVSCNAGTDPLPLAADAIVSIAVGSASRAEALPWSNGKLLAYSFRSAPARLLKRVDATMRRLVGSTQPTETSGVSSIETTLGAVERSGAIRVALMSASKLLFMFVTEASALASSSSVAGVEGNDNDAADVEVLILAGVELPDTRL